MKSEIITDIRGLSFQPLPSPLRIVSLVPSWTETLFHLGLTEAEIVGRTDYCIHPRSRVDNIERLGGPRDPNMARIFELDPTLVLMDQEENRKEDVRSIDTHWVPSRVFVTDPKTVNDALETVERFGVLFGAKGCARELIEDVRSLVAQVVRVSRGTVAYLVWQDPFIAASRETYIGDILEILGYKNVIGRGTVKDLSPERSKSYPVVTVSLLVRLKPDAIFLSTEPFPFRKRHIGSLRAQLLQFDSEYSDRIDIRIVNGEYFSWYGSRMIHAFRYFVKHQAQV
jgi:ABC-type Fe3+-hydroxamate transport system substrate-binding protein